MKTLLTAMATTAALLLGACSTGSTDESADSSELREMYVADQAARTGSSDEPTGPADQVRRDRVFELLAAGQVVTPADKFHAAMILQHTHLKFCGDDVVSASPENYWLAHCLARQALDAGHEEARLLVAYTMDRHWYYRTGRQKYGTHRVADPAAGTFGLAPIDTTVTDAERAEYGVPPLAELLGR